MKILLICSKAFYPRIAPIKKSLEEMKHQVELPNSYHTPGDESKSWELGQEEHSKYVARMLRMSEERIAEVDAVLALNFDKNGQENYIGGATFLELYEAFRQKKRIYLLHDIPRGMLYDEISGFSPTVLREDLSLLKE